MNDTDDETEKKKKAIYSYKIDIDIIQQLVLQRAMATTLKFTTVNVAGMHTPDRHVCKYLSI